MLVVATKNSNKVKEIKEIIGDMISEIKPMDELGIDIDIVEDGNTFEDNAYKKALEIMNITNLPTMSDDSGLEVYALDGAPGVNSARFAGEHGNSEKNNQKLIEHMKNIPLEMRDGRFVAVIVLLFPDGRKIVSRGEVEGYIGFEPKGGNGFGYDPLFIVPEYGKSFAELPSDVKNKISHRARALEKLRGELSSIMGDALF